MARIDGKPLRELSDAELEAELRRRRRARGHSGRTSRSAPVTRRPDGTTPGWKVRQWYRDLELEHGAPRREVEAAYQRLLARYDPDKHEADPEKHRAAMRLVAGLGEAYYGLCDHLAGKA